MARFGSLGTQYFDDAGDPLIKGFIKFEESGGGVDKDTFADVGLSIKNANPVPLSGAGRQPNIFFNGPARAVLFTSAMVQIEVRDPVGGESAEGQFSAYNDITIYNKNNIRLASDGNFYIAIEDGIQGDNPIDGSGQWSQVPLIRVWNILEAYNASDNDVVLRGGLLYTSVTDDNLGNDPTPDILKVNWKPSVEVSIPPVIRAASKIFASRNL